MIDTRELRYGNIVGYNSKHYQVCAIGSKIKIGTMINPTMYAGAFDVDINEINPIPLTEYILFKCGFVNSVGRDYEFGFDFDGSGIYCCDQITITYNTSDCCVYILQQFSDENNEVHCNNFAKIARSVKYVHELQNIFYCLTKTELNIQL